MQTLKDVQAEFAALDHKANGRGSYDEQPLIVRLAAVNIALRYMRA
mgnify:CR=1 FL=1